MPVVKFRILVGTAAFSALLILSGLFTGSSLLQSLLIALFPWAFFLLRYMPHILLFTLLFVRPALDGLSELVTFSVPFDHERLITAAQAFGLLTVVLGVVYFFFQWKNFRKTPLLLPFVILMIGGAATVIYSIDTTRTVYELLRLFSIFFIFLLAYNVIDSRKRFTHLLYVSVLSAVIPIVVAVYQYGNGIGYTDSSFSVPRIYGTFAHPNIFALYLIVILAVLLLVYFTSSRTIGKRIALGAFMAVLLVLVATYARAAWGTFLVFIASLSLIKYPKILPFLIIIPITIFAFSPTVQDRVMDGIDLAPSSSLMWRINLWSDTVNKTISDQQILLGYGLNTFEVVAEDLRGIQFVVNDPHSEFVRSFVEGGFIGFILFFYFSLAPVIVFWKLWRHNRDDIAGDVFLTLLCLWIALLLLSVTDHVLRSTMVQWILWAIFGGALRVFGASSTISHRSNPDSK